MRCGRRRKDRGVHGRQRSAAAAPNKAGVEDEVEGGRRRRRTGDGTPDQRSSPLRPLHRNFSKPPTLCTASLGSARSKRMTPDGEIRSPRPSVKSVVPRLAPLGCGSATLHSLRRGRMVRCSGGRRRRRLSREDRNSGEFRYGSKPRSAVSCATSGNEAGGPSGRCALLRLGALGSDRIRSA